MKKAFLLSLLSLQAALLIGCSRNPASVMPNQMVSTPGAALPTTGTGAGYSDPYGTGTGTGYGTTPGYSDPYGTGSSYGTTPGYGTGTGYGTTPGYSDPYGTGAGTGYGTTPGYGAGCTGMNTGYGAGNSYGVTPGYGTGAGYGTAPGYSDPYGTGYGTTPALGTGMPYGNNACDPGISQQIVTKIQSAGGYKALKADNVVVESLKTLSMPIQQAFQAAPLTNRVLIIKTLLDGWAGSDEVNYARQIWNTILPQEQQTLSAQDPELAKLVSKMTGSSNGVGSIFSELGKVLGIRK